MKSWLIAFEATKKYVMSIQHDSLEYELAFKRFSPKFFEFASSTTTSIDQLITTFDKETESLYETLNCSISEYDILTLGEEKVFQFQMPTTPISTKMTQLAILSNFLTKGSWFPNAVLANIWGTTDWSEYTILPGKGKKPSSLLTIDGKRLPIRNSTIYPQNLDLRNRGHWICHFFLLRHCYVFLAAEPRQSCQLQHSSSYLGYLLPGTRQQSWCHCSRVSSVVYLLWLCDSLPHMASKIMLVVCSGRRSPIFSLLG